MSIGMFCLQSRFIKSAPSHSSTSSIPIPPEVCPPLQQFQIQYNTIQILVCRGSQAAPCSAICRCFAQPLWSESARFLRELQCFRWRADLRTSRWNIYWFHLLFLKGSKMKRIWSAQVLVCHLAIRSHRDQGYWQWVSLNFISGPFNQDEKNALLATKKKICKPVSLYKPRKHYIVEKYSYSLVKSL